MQLNYDFIDYFTAIHIRAKICEDQSKLPLIARKIIELGKERGIKINIRYGTLTEGDSIFVGYWITAVDFGKYFFKQDIYIEDDSEDNLKKALEFMNNQINYLINDK